MPRRGKRVLKALELEQQELAENLALPNLGPHYVISHRGRTDHQAPIEFQEEVPGPRPHKLGNTGKDAAVMHRLSSHLVHHQVRFQDTTVLRNWVVC